MSEASRKGLLTVGGKGELAPSPRHSLVGSAAEYLSKPPGLAESLVPVWGPGREAIPEFEHGNTAMGLLDVGFAVADAIPGIDGLSWSARAARRGAQLVRTSYKKGLKIGLDNAFKRGWSHSAVRARLRTAGVIKPGEEMHHAIIPSGRWGKNVPNIIKNSSWNLKSLNPVKHARLSYPKNGLPRFNAVQRIAVGTPDSVRNAGIYAVDHVGSSPVGKGNGAAHGSR